MILGPGPTEELKVVKRVYEMFVQGGKSEFEIADLLNREGHLTDLGRSWTRGTIHQLLTNEKYIGNNVYNRVSFKLKQRRVVNTPDMWVRLNAAFDAVVPHDLFYAAQRIIHERTKRFSDADMLERLTALLTDKGQLSALIIDEVENMPSSSAYRYRFGSLLRAYQLIGYSPSRDYRYMEINRALRAMYPGILSETIAAIETIGGNISCDPVTDLLTINGEFTASIVIVRCLRTGSGALRWKIRFDVALCPDITVALRMNEANQHVLDYYLLPHIDFGSGKIRLSEDNGVFLDSYRFETLDPFLRLTARSHVRTAA